MTSNQPLIGLEDFLVLNPPDFSKLTPRRQLRSLDAAHRLGVAYHDYLLSEDSYGARRARQPDHTFFHAALYCGHNIFAENVWSESTRWEKRLYAVDWHDEPRLLAFLVGWRERVATVRVEKEQQKKAYRTAGR